MDLLQVGKTVMDDHHRILRKGGGDAWIHLRAATVPASAEHAGFVIAVARDETRERESRMRRELAARIAVDLAAADDLESVLATAVTGFTVLFDGAVTLRVAPERGDTVVLSPRGRVRVEQLPHPVRQGLLGGRAPTSAPVTSGRVSCWPPSRSGPTAARGCSSTSRASCRPTSSSSATCSPRRWGRRSTVSSTVATVRPKQEQLGQAIESHRLIGQAVGILIERHRTTPVEAFEMLRQASLHRNIKLREIAQRVVESGEEPTTA